MEQGMEQGMEKGFVASDIRMEGTTQCTNMAEKESTKKSKKFEKKSASGQIVLTEQVTLLLSTQYINLQMFQLSKCLFHGIQVLQCILLFLC
jgi:hypothetical protein